MKRRTGSAFLVLGFVLILVADIWLLTLLVKPVEQITWFLFNGLVLVVVGAFPGWWEK